ncbi:MAG: GAF domain-containing protein, partial [Acidobacteria bacterium]|nr:GAF domain-containing protein [Acidobacteriota bacterium]
MNANQLPYAVLDRDVVAMSHGKSSAHGVGDTVPTFGAPRDGTPSTGSRGGTARETLNTLAKVNRVVLRENDRVTMLDAVCKILIEHRDYIYAWVGLNRQNSGDVFLAAASGPTCTFLEDFSLSGDGSSDRGPLCAVRAIRNAAPFLIDGSEHEDPCPECPTRREYPGRTTLALPLIRDGKNYGVFVVHATGPGIFDRQEQALLADLADNIAYALEKLEADERGENHLVEVMLLNEITRVALESTTIGEALPLLATQLQGALNADGCDLALWNIQRQEITSVASTAEEGADSPRSCPQSEGVAAVLAANRPVPCGPGCMPISAPGPKGPYIMGMPLVAHSTPLGAAFVTFNEERPCVQCDLSRARTITGHIALAIAHTTTVEANSRRIKALLALHETSVDLAGHHDIKALLRAIVVRAGKLVGTGMGGLYLTVPNGLQMVVARGMLEPFIDQVLPLGEGASGRAVNSRKAILINDYATWEGSSPMYADLRVGSVIAAPLL